VFSKHESFFSRLAREFDGFHLLALLVEFKASGKVESALGGS